MCDMTDHKIIDRLHRGKVGHGELYRDKKAGTITLRRLDARIQEIYPKTFARFFK
jgi:hypothetical protein